MSQENVEVMRRLFEEASQGDPAVVDILDPDTLKVIFKNLHSEVELHEDPRFPEAGVYRGVDEVRNYWINFTENFDIFSWEVDEFVDRLAAIEHERWAHWQQYMHDQGKRTEDGSLVIPAALVTRWSEQIATPYANLSETEKESDREQVRKYLPAVVDQLTRATRSS